MVIYKVATVTKHIGDMEESIGLFTARNIAQAVAEAANTLANKYRVGRGDKVKADPVFVVKTTVAFDGCDIPWLIENNKDIINDCSY